MSIKTTQSNLELFVKKMPTSRKGKPEAQFLLKPIQTELKKLDYIYKNKDTFLLPKYAEVIR